ncbi:DNA polymerase III subunit alpha [Candidatus Uhrbacteria bacterium]|nr:DNA polymerase III subunit alpha [Candidatus Uhrbacteria bacterium]
MPSPFVHLHVHSHYSLLEALPKVKEILYHLKDCKMDAVAITDNGALYGAIEFIQKAQEAGIKPIIGMDAYIAREGRYLKRPRIDAKPARLVLLAENLTGYLNLLTLSSIGFLEGFYYKPRLDKELLRAHREGIIALSGGFQGEIDEALNGHDPEKAKTTAREYVDIFGAGNFFLELVDRPEIAEQETVNAKLIELGRELNIPLVAAKNTFYIRPTDVEAWKILNCIKGGKTLEDFNRLSQFDYDASMVTGEYMEERFKDVPEAIENTRKIADRCVVPLELGKWNFPKFVIPEGTTFREVLTKRAYTEILDKVPSLTDEMRKRLDYELEIIDQKGFCPYFLIVSDFIEWSRKNGIVTTTRGSAAGSLVGFSIGISAIDPLRFELPFERFLNPERPSAPDIDADFADNRRDEVLDYVRGKYGAEKVAQICTFGKMLARGSVRDVGRALGEPYDFVDVLAKMVPMGSQGFPMTLKRALEEEPELKKRYATDARVRRIIDLAMRIEGCARHVSVHAAGTVVSPTALTDFTPIQIDTKEGKVITQYEMKSVEAAGLIKFDFLGIRNLSILGDAVALVKKTKGIDIQIERVAIDDKKTFELLAHGHTMGVFQLGGDGMTKYLMELKPERVEDIMAMVALYRPGPIESIPEYIKRKHNASLVIFMDPRLQTILNKSYGVIVYQDDVMLIAIHLAGYSWLDADKLRKAMGKKIPEEMAAQKVKLLEGFVKHGLSKQKTQHLWELIEPFAAYGFNKAHAASYGMVAYQTAFMKANYPAEYMTALMTAESGDLEKIAAAVKECERMGIAVLPPDINESLADFTYIDDKTIRFGLVVIKNLGEEVVQTIIDERTAAGVFKDLSDFAARVAHRAFNKKALEALTKAGALDRFGERQTLLENMDRILMHNKSVQREKDQKQSTLFGLSEEVFSSQITLRPAPPASRLDRLYWEKELLGLYVSAHPFEEIDKVLGVHLIACSKVAAQSDGEFVRVGGIITAIKQINTKKGDAMAFVAFSDHRGSTEIIVFPKTFASYKNHLALGGMFLVSAKTTRREGEETKLIANSFIRVFDENVRDLDKMLRGGLWIADDPAQPMPVPEGRAQEAQGAQTAQAEARRGGSATRPPDGLEPTSSDPVDRSLVITLRGRPSQEIVTALRGLFSEFPGRDQVCFQVESAGTLRRIKTDHTVTKTLALLEEVAAVVGRENVV